MFDILTTYFWISIISFLSAVALVPLMKVLAFKFDVLDKPDGRIKVHKMATPYLGGVAIYFSFIISALFFGTIQEGFVWLYLGILILLVVGLIDDLIIFSPKQKLLGEILAVLFFLKGGFFLKAEFFSEFINVFCSGFWMLLVINAFNLVDVMDGLSSSIALIASISFFIVAIFSHNYLISFLILAFIFPLIVFLYHNFPPAKIYLGDAGALFIGGFLAIMPLLFPWSYFNTYGLLVPLVILGIPLFEVSSLIIIRTYKGIPFYQGSPHHFSSYLKRKGWSTKKILYFTVFSQIFLSTLSLSFLFGYLILGWFLLFIACILLIWSKMIFC